MLDMTLVTNYYFPIIKKETPTSGVSFFIIGVYRPALM